MLETHIGRVGGDFFRAFWYHPFVIANVHILVNDLPSRQPYVFMSFNIQVITMFLCWFSYLIPCATIRGVSTISSMHPRFHILIQRSKSDEPTCSLASNQARWLLWHKIWNLFKHLGLNMTIPSWLMGGMIWNTKNHQQIFVYFLNLI